ncbi:hypothetical protein [Desulforegula conservatrix]|uniref:hypothetical protein n=1 Tax=Desulforegula conservatrix TaxID=153026 RepID=UPI00042331B9|nr:hypothetical protein [Desulforegula conservatrix]
MSAESLSLLFAEDGDSAPEFYQIFNTFSEDSSDVNTLFFKFLSDTTKRQIKSVFRLDDLRDYKKSPSVHKGILANKIGGLWKEILIDAIYFLRINDSRERLFYKDKNTKSDMKQSVVEAVRRANTFGIDDLYAYFNQFTEFESILYGTDKFYRDHIIHPINVWIIGLHIIKKFGSSFKILSCEKIEVAKNDSGDNGQSKMHLSIAELSAMWTVISLTHDIGYPLEKVEKINDQLEKMLGQFGKIKFNRSNFAFENRHDNLVNFLINFISSVAKPDSNNPHSLTNHKQWKFWTKKSKIAKHKKDSKENNWFIHKRWKYWSKFSKSWEAYDHGIVSSLILLKSLTFFIEADYADSSPLTKNEDARQFAIRSEILHSIAAHTTPKIYHLLTNNLPFLLILCDEMQEWSRPTFSDIRAGARGRARRVELTELSIDKMNSKIEFKADYEDLPYDSQLILAEKIFSGWYERLRYALDDAERNLTFHWTLSFGEEAKFVWEFIFNSSNPTFEIVELMIPEGENDNCQKRKTIEDLKALREKLNNRHSSKK